MNEMNNGDNGFNNQNNVNYQEQQISYVQNTEYQDTSNNSYKEPSKKSYCGLLVVFMLISLGLAGYIVYDKAIKKEEMPSKCDIPQQSTTTVQECDNNIRCNSNDKFCYEYTINNKIHKLSLTYLHQLGQGDCGDEGLYHYVSIKGLLDNKSLFDNDLNNIYVNEETDYKTHELYTDFDIKKYVKTIKGDKDYLVFITKGSSSCTGTDTVLHIVNEDGEILKSITLIGDQGIEVTTPEGKAKYYDEINNKYYKFRIEQDSVYYLKGSSHSEYATEYKVTVNNDIVTEVKSATYDVEYSGAVY